MCIFGVTVINFHSMYCFLSLIRLERINVFLLCCTILLLFLNVIFYTQSNTVIRVVKTAGVEIPFSKNSYNQEVKKEFRNITDVILPQDSFLDTKYSYIVQKGDGLIKILSSIGFNLPDVYSILVQVSKLHDVSNIYAGQYLKFLFSSEDGRRVKIGEMPHHLTFYIDGKIIDGIYNKITSSYDLKLLKQTINNKSKLVHGYARESLYHSFISQGASPAIIMEYIKMLSNEVDFKKDVKANSKFCILFNYNETADGQKISEGNILYAYLSIDSKKHEVYRYKDNKGNASYHYADGRNLKSTLLSQPIKKARISSGFGMRFHPILKYNKLHKGLDYAAKTGTPILAAGNGVVQVMRYGVGYGKYLAIKHNNIYSTLYAHMSRFNPGITRGMVVKKGNIIGYVGNTGSSTAAHLHYEIRRYGEPINPMKVKALISTPLDGKKLIAFNNQKKKIDDIIMQKGQ